MLHIAISVKMDAVMLIVGDTALLLVSDGTLISLRSSDLKSGPSTERRAAHIFLSSVFRVRGRATQLKASLCLRAFRTAPTRVLLWACLLPVLPKSGSSATGSVGSQVRSYASAVW